MSGKKSHLFAESMLLLAVLSWAVSFPIAKLAMTGWSSYKFFFLAGRFWLAFAIFALLAARTCSLEKLFAHAKPGFWVGIALAATYGFQYKALSIGASGEVAFITALNSVLVPIGVWIVFRKRVEAVIWLGLIIATIGAILVGYDGSFSITKAGWFAFISAVGMAADVILINYFMEQKADKQAVEEEQATEAAAAQAIQNADELPSKYEEVPFLVMQFLVLAVVTTVLSLLTEVTVGGLPSWSSNAVFGMVFMAIVATAGAFFIQTKYQPMTSTERAALIFILEPPIAGLFGYLLLSEAFTRTMLLGAILIVVGVALAEILTARRPKPIEERQHKQGEGVFARALALVAVLIVVASVILFFNR